MLTPPSSVLGFKGIRWPNFTANEFTCNHCGEYYHDERVLDALQAARSEIGKPIRINSAHRCRYHNARVGGAPLSQHLKLAIDIDLRRQNPRRLSGALIRAGFKGVGYYTNFIHVDMGRKRFWHGSEYSRKKWELLLK